MPAIRDVKLSALLAETEFQLSAFEHSAVVIVQHRDQDLPMQFFFQRPPVDVEKARVRGSLSILQHVHPPRVVASHHRHVIGDDIENQAHPMFVQNFDESIEILGTADLRIQ